MTTKVTVDAHAGWPVKVEAIDTDLAGVATTPNLLGEVPAGQVMEFHATDTRQILVTEMKRD